MVNLFKSINKANSSIDKFTSKGKTNNTGFNNTGKFKKYAKKSLGFALVEVALVAFFVTAIAGVSYNTHHKNEVTNTVQNQSTYLVQLDNAIKSSFASASDYNKLNNANLIALGVVPPKMIQNGNLVTLWGSPINVGPMIVNGQPGYAITLTNSPNSICARLAIDNGNRFYQIGAVSSITYDSYSSTTPDASAAGSSGSTPGGINNAANNSTNSSGSRPSGYLNTISTNLKNSSNPNTASLSVLPDQALLACNSDSGTNAVTFGNFGLRGVDPIISAATSSAASTATSFTSPGTSTGAGTGIGRTSAVIGATNTGVTNFITASGSAPILALGTKTKCATEPYASNPTWTGPCPNTYLGPTNNADFDYCRPTGSACGTTYASTSFGVLSDGSPDGPSLHPELICLTDVQLITYASSGYPGVSDGSTAFVPDLVSCSPLPTVSISFSPGFVAAATNSNLTWSSSNATSGSLNCTNGYLNSGLSGSILVGALWTPGSTYTCTFTATSPTGTTSNSSTLTIGAAPIVPTAFLSANGFASTTVIPGASVNLNWATANAGCGTGFGCSISINCTDGFSTGQLAQSGITSWSNFATGVYTCTLQASGPSGAATSSVVITVASTAPTCTGVSAAFISRDILRTTITGVVNTTVVNVADWGIINWQNDIAWQTAVDMGGGVWQVDRNVTIAPMIGEEGDYMSHVYLNGFVTWCGGANPTPRPLPTPAPTATLTFNPTSTSYGTDSMLTWSSTNATSGTISCDSGYGNGAAGMSDSVSVGATWSPSGTYTCTYNVSGVGGMATATATLTITPLVCAGGTAWNGSACVTVTYYTASVISFGPLIDVFCKTDGACKAGLYASFGGCTTTTTVNPAVLTAPGSQLIPGLGPTEFAFVPMDVSIIPFSCR